MVKITNGVSVFEVTRGAFDGIYSRQGYTLVNEKPAENTDEVVDNIPEKTEDEKFIDEIVEKPISQWTKEEIRRFASIKDIDISDTKGPTEAKELIKQFLEENK